MTADLASAKCFASLDIGSHTTRMLIVRKEGRDLVPVCSERRVTRLALNFPDGAITEEAQHRNISALKEYVSILREFSGRKNRLRSNRGYTAREKFQCGAL